MAIAQWRNARGSISGNTRTRETDCLQNAYLRWPYWVALVVLTVIASAGAAYLGAYFKQSGEAKAINDKLDLITHNLAAMTRVTESIKSDFGMMDWRRREYEATRRMKLEELLIASFECYDWGIRLAGADSLDDETFKVLGPSNKIGALALAYFPELREHATAIANLAQQYLRVAIDAARAKAEIKALDKLDGPASKARAKELRSGADERNSLTRARITPLHDAIRAIQAAASKIMDDALTPQAQFAAISAVPTASTA